MQSFEGRVAVITGAASGIGEGLARHGAQEGMRLLLADVDEARLQWLVQDLQKQGVEVQGQVTDVADAASVEQLAEMTWQCFGGADVVFNNAGVLISSPSWECPVQDWQWVLNINLMGVIHGIHSFVPRMLAAGNPGHIVNTSSLAGLLAAPLMGPYTVSKQAVLALSETLHYELADTTLNVSVLCPGPVATHIADSGHGRGVMKNASPDQQQLQAFLSSGIASGMSPADCADRVFSAIREEQFWIFTHEDFREEYQRRVDALMQGANPEYRMYVTGD